MYRLSIWLIAIAFVFNGAASRALTELPAVPALAAQEHHDAHADHSAGVVADADHSQDHKHGDKCLKCCGLCNVASVIPDLVANPATFSDAAITFNTGQHDLVGHLVALDPDIPKTVV